MEDLAIALSSAPQLRRRAPLLVGVVASGNCEVLVEARPDAGAACQVAVHTSAMGFAPIWHAVLTDFAARRRAGGLCIEINDAGATPAIVSLRLDQAIEAWEDDHA